MTGPGRDAPGRNAVVLACDEGHLPLAMFCADRIRRSEPGGAFDICIFMPRLDAVAQRHLDGPVTFREIDAAGLPEAPRAKEWITSATYFRWLLPETLAQDYDTILYLDTDTYLARPGIGALFDSIDRPVALAASQEFWNLDEGAMDPKRRAKVDDLGGASRRYFNAGIFLSQPSEFLRIGGPERIRKAIVENIPFLPIHKDQDQGAMNLAFSDDIQTLNPLFNWRTMHWMNRRNVDSYAPYILHFTGPNKPWTRQDNAFIASFAEEYLDFLGREFPDFAIKPAPGSLAWRKLNPKHGSKAMHRLNMWLYKRRYDRKHRRIGEETDGPRFQQMDTAIRSSEVGNPARL